MHSKMCAECAESSRESGKAGPGFLGKEELRIIFKTRRRRGSWGGPEEIFHKDFHKAEKGITSLTEGGRTF